jgi:hypothetical protein
MGMRFLPGRRICAVCGRECGPDGATAAELDPTVEVSAEGLELVAAVTSGEALVICKDCAAR